MSIDIGRTVSLSIDRVTTPAGAVLVVATAVTNTLYLLGYFSLLLPSTFGSSGSGAAFSPPGMELVSGLSAGVSGLAMLVGWLGSVVLFVLAVDAFSRGVDAPGDLGTSGLAWKIGNLIVGYIVATIVIVIGLAFLVLPGLLAAIALMFFPIAVVVDDESFISAFGSSVGVVRENVFGTLGLIVLMFVVGVVATIGMFVSVLIPVLAVAFAVVLLVMASINMFTLAVLTFGYTQGSQAVDGSGPSGDSAGAPGQTV